MPASTTWKECIEAAALLRTGTNWRQLLLQAAETSAWSGWMEALLRAPHSDSLMCTAFPKVLASVQMSHWKAFVSAVQLSYIEDVRAPDDQHHGGVRA